MALNPLNSSNLEQLALKGLTMLVFRLLITYVCMCVCGLDTSCVLIRGERSGEKTATSVSLVE